FTPFRKYSMRRGFGYMTFKSCRRMAVACEYSDVTQQTLVRCATVCLLSCVQKRRRVCRAWQSTKGFSRKRIRSRTTCWLFSLNKSVQAEKSPHTVRQQRETLC